MNITRPKDLSVLKDIEPYISASHPDLIPIIQADIAQLMAHSPAALLFLTWYDEQKDLRAFTITSDPGPAYPYAAVWQVWGHSDNPRNWINPFFARMVLWAVAHDKEYLRTESQRTPSAIYRRFGFEPHIQILKYDLAKTVIYEKLTERPEEILHGQ